mmetsp:Transcript_7078/g.23227  ORF Transcript_7078/g.23227 Transcript_7078/m.23227 type:complete len:330 (-) Transcript_7078:62-1051(-)
MASFSFSVLMVWLAGPLLAGAFHQPHVFHQPHQTLRSFRFSSSSSSQKRTSVRRSFFLVSSAEFYELASFYNLTPGQEAMFERLTTTLAFGSLLACFLIAGRELTGSNVPKLASSPTFPNNRDSILEAFRASGMADPSKVILDVACGSGQHAPYFAMMLGSSSPVFQPVDSDPECVKNSDERSKELGVLGEEVLPAQLLDIGQVDWPVVPGAYDGCIAIGILTQDSQDAFPHLFREVARATKPDGQFAVCNLFTIAGQFPNAKTKEIDMLARQAGRMGVVALEAVDAAASAVGFERAKDQLIEAKDEFVVVYKKVANAPNDEETPHPAA